MMVKTIEEIEHTADCSIRVRGRDLGELFVNAARGMFGLMADLEAVEAGVERQVQLYELDAETLLVSWLSELLWFNEESGAVFVRFEIASLTATALQATAWGGAAPSQWKQIKAVTFHDLRIVETEDGHEVTLVFDV
jgi:SHS2 domain-containing protein